MANDSVIRLEYRDKVSVSSMKEIIKSTLDENLKDSKYDGEACANKTKELADTIRNSLKGLGTDRYKFVVQVVIGERREQGVRMGTRCFWDSNTDNQASETFINDQLYCVATAFAVYLY